MRTTKKYENKNEGLMCDDSRINDYQKVLNQVFRLGNFQMYPTSNMCSLG